MKKIIENGIEKYQIAENEIFNFATGKALSAGEYCFKEEGVYKIAGGECFYIYNPKIGMICHCTEEQAKKRLSSYELKLTGNGKKWVRSIEGEDDAYIFKGNWVNGSGNTYLLGDGVYIYFEDGNKYYIQVSSGKRQDITLEEAKKIAKSLDEKSLLKSIDNRAKSSQNSTKKGTLRKFGVNQFVKRVKTRTGISIPDEKIIAFAKSENLGTKVEISYTRKNGKSISYTRTYYTYIDIRSICNNRELS